MQRTVGSTHAVVPPAWQSLVDRLGAALASYPTGGHAISLALAGALLDDVPPEVVPAIVDAATASWNAPSPGHYRRNAEDTVATWARGYPVRRDVPPAVRAVLTTPATEPLDEITRQLENAIGNAGDGVTVIRAGCGVGKTRCAEHAAQTRAARDGVHKQNVRTIISVPTNDLAIQIAEHLPGCLRIFGPASVHGDHDGWECRCRASASALAAGGLSIRWELCEGRGENPCEHRATCGAVDGAKGPDDARIVVGNHGLLHDLADRAGATGLLVVDEPPPILDDIIITASDIDTTARMLRDFDSTYAAAMRPALDAISRWLSGAPIGSRCHLSDALGDADPDLLDDAFRATGAETAADAVGTTPRRTPPVAMSAIAIARSNLGYAQQLGTACRVLRAIRRGVTDDAVHCAAFETRAEHPTRYLALTGVRADLSDALRREGRTVVMAADSHLYLEHLRELLGYAPRYLDLPAPDGVAVRRIVIRARRANRTEWLVRGRPPAGLLAQALALATGRIAVVTFQALEPWVRDRAPDVATGHYGALRGLDTWASYDTLVTLGDPLPNLDHVSRTTEDDPGDRARALAQAELEQAHGRLRPVHRTTPCTMIHVGGLLPDGWRAPVEEIEPTEGGRPRAPAPAVDVGALVRSAGGIRAVARALHVAPVTCLRWARGERVPSGNVVSAIASLSCSGLSGGVTETTHRDASY